MMMMMAQVADQKRRSHDDDDDDGCLLSSVVGAAAGHGHPTSSYGDVAAAKRLKTRGGGTMSAKEKKDKIGERVAALQQLVSPFGKSDTASVLQEATGYIRFLHEQLQVLSSPYMRTPLIGQAEGAEYYSLRSRGLCLVPVSSTVKFAQSNGADLWAPANSRRCQ